MLAAGQGHIHVVEILVQKGADVNTQDRVCLKASLFLLGIRMI